MGDGERFELGDRLGVPAIRDERLGEIEPLARSIRPELVGAQKMRYRLGEFLPFHRDPPEARLHESVRRILLRGGEIPGARLFEICPLEGEIGDDHLRPARNEVEFEETLLGRRRRQGDDNERDRMEEAGEEQREDGPLEMFRPCEPPPEFPQRVDRERRRRHGQHVPLEAPVDEIRAEDDRRESGDGARREKLALSGSGIARGILRLVPGARREESDPGDRSRPSDQERVESVQERVSAERERRSERAGPIEPRSPRDRRKGDLRGREAKDEDGARGERSLSRAGSPSPAHEQIDERGHEKRRREMREDGGGEQDGGKRERALASQEAD